MPIQSDDIKLLRSAVMADVPEGGGAATGIEIIDGQSNNIFPDTSTDDRAAGRVNLRKVFGAAHTDDTDTLLGASFAVLEPPEDPLVHVTLFETPGWADTRTAAKELVERYLVKGPRLACRIMDTHYAGSLLLQLYQVGGNNFPAAGDAIVLRNPNGAEQYVRVVKVTLSTGTFNVAEGTTVTTFGANIAVCELGQQLSFDVLGPPIARVTNEAAFALAYTTTVAAGVAFHGVKRLAVSAAVSDRAVYADGGIYSPLVPASTVEEPLIDIAPLLTRQSLSRTALTALTLPTQTLTMQPGTVLRLPTAVEPGSLTITRGATTFTDDGQGALLQGSTVVGEVSYAGKSITMAGGSPSYGSASTVISYRPATPSGAATHSHALTITTANQGLGFTAAFEPPPAPATFTVSYMAQGRWYDLIDNGNGKLAGADNSYGAGSVNYTTGSVAYTLGAIPDVGSAIIHAWGDAATAVAAPSADLPARLSSTLAIDSRARPETVGLSWSRGANNYTATVAADGTVSGNATGRLTPGELIFAPAVLPDGAVTVTYDRAPNEFSNSVNQSGGNYQLPNFPITPGSVRLYIGVVPQNGFELPSAIYVVDRGTGTLVSNTLGSFGAVVGTINYSNGEVVLYPNVGMQVYERVVQSYPVGSNTLYYEARVLRNAHSATLLSESVNSFMYAAGGPVSGTASLTPAWGFNLPLLTGLALKTDALAFSVGDAVYASQAGSLTRAWSASNGSGLAAGAVTSGGVVTVTSLPPNGVNSVTWHNVAHDRQVGRVGQGVFRVASAPIKTGVFQIQSGALVGAANDSGVISGGGWNGTVDFQRGIVRWNRTNNVSGPWFGGISTWLASDPVAADQLTYNAVFLQYLPLDGTLLGLETARLPLDGRVPIYRPGGQVIVHNTLTTQLPNPLVKGTTYSLGRERIAAVVVRTAAGVKVPGSLYDVDFNAGTVVFPPASDLTGLDQPFTAHHRIEDELMLLRADINGKLDLVAGLTHNYPAGTSYVSSKLRKGDLFSRAFLYLEQSSWTGVWSDELIGSAPTASYNNVDFPIQTTNRGAISEQWAVIFTGATQVRVVGRDVGQVLTSVSINAPIEPLNPQTGAPYFSIPALGWGGGWAIGNVLRFNTAAAGAPAWSVRTVLQGPPSVASDAATIAFRSDVDA